MGDSIFSKTIKCEACQMFTAPLANDDYVGLFRCKKCILNEKLRCKIVALEEHISMLIKKMTGMHAFENDNHSLRTPGFNKDISGSIMGDLTVVCKTVSGSVLNEQLAEGKPHKRISVRLVDCMKTPGLSSRSRSEDLEEPGGNGLERNGSGDYLFSGGSKKPEVEVKQVQQKSTKLPHQCCQCGKIFSILSILKLHQRTHTGLKPYHCMVCEKMFTQAGSLKVHQRRHSGDKPHTCSVCGKRFTVSKDLKRHQLIHKGEKSFLCSDCGKSFAFLDILKSHQLTHTGEKKFTCTTCKRAFLRSGDLRSHLVTHSGEKPHSCSLCGKSFARSGTLKKHQKTHSGEKPYTCSVCEKSFSESEHLKRHQRIHTGEKPYHCSVCPKTFNTSGNLNKHKLTHR